MSFNNKTFTIIGHRGAKGLAPENTLRSFQTAAALNVDAIEFDVHCCQDEFVIIHDQNVASTTNGSGCVDSFAVEDLQKLDAGMGERIPILAEALSAIPSEIAINIELKGAGTAVLGRKFDLQDREYLVSSFRESELIDFKRIRADISVALLCLRFTADHLKVASDLDAMAINIGEISASYESINTIRDAGFKAYVFTINRLDRAQELMEWGASGVFTDRPDLVNPKLLYH